MRVLLTVPLTALPDASRGLTPPAPMALFDRYIIVDWSAAGSPKTRADSIWIGHHADGASALANPATRAEAEALLRRHIAEADAVGARLFMGFDFAFGYPEGAAAALTGDGDWRALWAQIAETMQDDAQNANNRFDVAAHAVAPCQTPRRGRCKRHSRDVEVKRRGRSWGANPHRHRDARATAPKP